MSSQNATTVRSKQKNGNANVSTANRINRIRELQSQKALDADFLLTRRLRIGGLINAAFISVSITFGWHGQNNLSLAFSVLFALNLLRVFGLYRDRRRTEQEIKAPLILPSHVWAHLQHLGVDGVTWDWIPTSNDARAPQITSVQFVLDQTLLELQQNPIDGSVTLSSPELGPKDDRWRLIFKIDYHPDKRFNRIFCPALDKLEDSRPDDAEIGTCMALALFIGHRQFTESVLDTPERAAIQHLPKFLENRVAASPQPPSPPDPDGTEIILTEEDEVNLPVPHGKMQS